MQPAPAGGGGSAAPAFEFLADAFDEAADRHPQELVERHYRFAGRHVALFTVGRALAGYLGRAIGHLEDPEARGSPTDLRVRMLDAAAVPTPAGYAVSGDPDGVEELSDVAGGRYIRDARGQYHAVFDRTGGEIAGVARFGERRPLLHDYGKPLQVLLSVWYLDSGVPLVHAGLVARRGRGILLGGEGGSGKSTTSLNCVRAGFDFLGDDRVGLSRDGAAFVGHGIFNSVLVDAVRLDRYPELARHAVAPAHGREAKPLAFLSEVWPARLPASARVGMVVIPKIGAGQPTRLEPLAGSQALLEMAPSSLILPMGPGARGMRSMADLLRAVPAFRLWLGDAEQRVPALLQEALEKWG